MNLGGESSMLCAIKTRVENQVSKNMSFLIPSLSTVFLIGLATVPALGGERPSIPSAGEDMKLTKGVSAQQFFAARLEDKQCQEQLQIVRAQFESDKKALNDLVLQKADATIIDHAESKMVESRKDLLMKTRQCGLCTTQDLDKKVVTTNKKEYWYLTDGSCYLGINKSQSELDQLYERAVRRLKNIKKYPSKNGGFRALLEFNEIDMDSGELLPPTDQVEHSPFYAFIGVRGPVALGLPVGFWYVFKNDLIEKQTGDLKEFIIRFESVKKPANFPTPDLKIQSASGQLHSTIQKELTLVQGMWYVNNQGYFRYYTGADFGVNIPFGIDFALNTLLDTLLTLTEDSTSAE
ncbi:MAG: hypothetical protein EBR01_05165 [Proteobacteria bacterium]|nr:hypothetical protein [Pseudomonadota bacterium]